MQGSISPLITKLKRELKNFLKDKEILDIFLIGSSIKDKAEPKDIDLIVLLRNKDYEKRDSLIYGIKKTISMPSVHIESVFSDDFLNQKIFSSILHEGISLKNEKPLSEVIGYASFSLFTYSLENLKNIEKVRLAQTVYGRKNNGLLQKENGHSLGKGVFIVSVNKEELFKEVLTKFNVPYEIKRAFINY